MKPRTAIAVVCLSVGLAAQSQHFEVAAIRPSTAAPGAGTSFETFDGGRIRIGNEPLKLLIRLAYQVQNSQIAGGPAWVETDPYDIDAKTGLPGKPAPGDLGPLMRNLLEDRCHLKVHRETRELSVFALVVACGGSRLTQSAEDAVSGMKTTNSRATQQATATATTMPLLASYVGNRLGRIVVDKTGLAGRYDFKLEWAP